MTDEAFHAFQRFLSWLSPDPERAARRYTDMHIQLTKLFARHECDEPHHLADETLDRVVGKVEALAAGYQGDPEAYVLAVARRVVLEHARSRKRRSRRAGELEQALPTSVLPDAERERQHACLEDCLAELSTEERNLILMYYSERGSDRRLQRRVLAEDVRLSDVALRKRTQRIRERLKSKLVATT